MADFNLPADFVNKMKALLQDEWEEFIDCYENQKYQALRFNALKVKNKEDEERILQSLGADANSTVPWAKHGYYYENDLRPGKHAYHEMGLYYIQEPSAMSAAELLDVKPGDIVLDLCSAPGGKATQIASHLQGEGLLVSNEIHPARCKILSQNIERMGIGNAVVTNEDPAGLSSHFPVFFDKILVDAPCSGEGMFRKNPEAMEEWSLSQVQVCADRQADILEHAAIMLKPGGRLVYSTCTFAPEEDEISMARFLKSHPDFSVLGVEAPYFSKAHAEWADKDIYTSEIADTYRLWPHKLHGEGHYVAVLEKKADESLGDADVPGRTEKVMTESVGKAEAYFSKNQKKNKKGKGSQKSGKGNGGVLNKECQAALESFLNETLQPDIAGKLAKANFVLFGDNLYALPNEIESLAGLRVERAGLQIGTFKKNRFEPSHALALYLKKEDVFYHVDLALADLRVAGYFRGEGFFINGGELFLQSGDAVLNYEHVKGYCLVCVDGYPAGFGKLLNGQVKNHYPKGLRKEI